MTIQETVEALQHEPLEYRLEVIERLVQSLKNDMARADPPKKPFRVRAFNLGTDVSVDRESIYGTRGV